MSCCISACLWNYTYILSRILNRSIQYITSTGGFEPITTFVSYSHMVYQWTPCILSTALLIDFDIKCALYFCPLAWGIRIVIVWLMMLNKPDSSQQMGPSPPEAPSWSEMVSVVKHHPSTHEMVINLFGKSHQLCRRINILNIWCLVSHSVDGWEYLR